MGWLSACRSDCCQFPFSCWHCGCSSSSQGAMLNMLNIAIRNLAVVVMLTLCNCGGTPAEYSFCEQLDQPTTWQPVFTASSQNDPACPAYGTRTETVSDTSYACESGCSCHFGFHASSLGNSDYKVPQCNVAFSMQCPDGSHAYV